VLQDGHGNRLDPPRRWVILGVMAQLMLEAQVEGPLGV
jgi:hypothetical protein